MEQFTMAPVLLCPYPCLHFIVEMDASNSRVGLVLSLISPKDGKTSPCTFFPKSLSPAEKNKVRNWTLRCGVVFGGVATLSGSTFCSKDWISKVLLTYSMLLLTYALLNNWILVKLGEISQYPSYLLSRIPWNQMISLPSTPGRKRRPSW